MMSADRMDWLVEKATELGVVQLQPVLAERSSLRLDGERAQRKQQHWQAVAVSACEQSGRNRLPTVHAPQAMRAFLRDAAGAGSTRWLLSLDAEALPLRAALCDLPSAQPVIVLSGPEGGLSPDEEAAARAAGFVPVSLGHRVLRAETAPLAALSVLTLV
jgi:16S rRNA (uracil1498-N3)-methyltransferase